MIQNFTFLELSQVTSTQDVAHELARDGKLSHSMVIIAKEQTKGRGRYDRTWLSPEGGLYISIVLKPPLKLEYWSQISYVIGISLCEAIMHIDPTTVPKLKWVNDVLIGNKKVAGILLELIEGETLVVGMGVNLKANARVDELLGAHLDGKFKAEELLDVFLRRLKYNYNLWCDTGFEPIRTLWLRMAYGIGKAINVNLRTQTQSGTLIGIDDLGRLQLLDGATMRLISAGDVFFH